jgi:hypothetical protein
MADENFKLDVDADGIALVTWDQPGRSMNVIDLSTIEELGKIVERIASDGAIKGAVVTSGKDTFCAGADLALLETLTRSFAGMAKCQGEEAAATSSRSSTGAWRTAASRSWQPSTGLRSAAGSSFASLATGASPPTARTPAWVCPKSRSVFFPAPVARSASRA